jgi:hypothetical protein
VSVSQKTSRYNIKHLEAENRLRFVDRTHLSQTYSKGLSKQYGPRVCTAEANLIAGQLKFKGEDCFGDVGVNGSIIFK